MRYAVRRTVDDRGREQIDLFAMETPVETPPGYRKMSRRRFMDAWRERDLSDLARLRDAARAEAARRKTAKR